MKKQFFTLVEILVTIGIILVLAGILIPAIQKGITKGEITKCKAQAVTLVNAIKQYEATYGKLPSNFQGSTSPYNDADKSLVKSGKYAEFIRILQADPDYSTLTTYNPRKIKFLERQGGEDYGVYEDPWENDFFILLDSDYNDLIPPSDIPGANSGKKFPLTILVGSNGPDGVVIGEEYATTDEFTILVGSNGPDGEQNSTASNSKNKDNVFSADMMWVDGKGFELTK